MIKLRRWQVDGRELVQGLRARGSDRALVAACPGSGKTVFAVSLFHDDLAARLIDLVIIVCPSRALKRQWQHACKRFGLKAQTGIDNGTLEDRAARGMELFDPDRPIHIVTYAQVCSFPDLFATQCAKYKVFVVFDEIHHADDQAEYGQALLSGFEDAVFKLSLSGTPATTRGSRLAFCSCRSEITPDGRAVNVTNIDYGYSYGAALKVTGTSDDPYVVRPVTFMRWNGHARWRFQDVASKQINERVFDGSRKSDPLTPLLDPELPSLKKMIQAALAELENVRRHQKNAGMLITTQDAEHADQVIGLLHTLGVRDVIRVVHDTPGAQDKIEAFDRGKDRVLVAIKMISEGVDIVRLRVGVYASNVLTWLFFMQFVGRFIRWDGSLGAGQSACVFIPEHITLIEYAKRIEEMVLAADIAASEPGKAPPAPSTESIMIAKDGDGAMNGAIQHGDLFEAIETEQIKEWIRSAGVDLDLARAKRLWDTRGGAEGSQPNDERSGVDEPDESQRNDKLVATIVRRAKAKGQENVTYESVQAAANRAVGIPKKDKLTPEAILVRRREFLQQWLYAIVIGPDDDAVSA